MKRNNEYVPIIKDSNHPLLSGNYSKKYNVPIDAFDIIGAVVSIFVLLSAYLFVECRF